MTQLHFCLNLEGTVSGMFHRLHLSLSVEGTELNAKPQQAIPHGTPTKRLYVSLSLAGR